MRDCRPPARPADRSNVTRVEDFPYAAEIRVRFAETDAQGVVNNAAYLVWFEIARVGYLEQFAGGYQRLRDQGLEAFVRESHVRYVVPARFDDHLLVHARVRDQRGARFRYEYVIMRGEETIADGWTAHAFVDARTFRPTRAPAWLVEAITRAESAG
jgi:acyl-CoA thioester hydrolase